MPQSHSDHGVVCPRCGQWTRDEAGGTAPLQGHVGRLPSPSAEEHLPGWLKCLLLALAMAVLVGGVLLMFPPAP
jgi:hypothetical protein